MGWKSTINITRREAITAIMHAVDKTPYDDMTNEQLEDMMCELGIGNEIGLPYYGYNFDVSDAIEK
jgi:hypothetical protein